MSIMATWVAIETVLEFTREYFISIPSLESRTYSDYRDNR